jgi:hypothetical protein
MIPILKDIHLKTVASFRDPYEAHIARGKLETEGIPTVVLDEHLIQVDWLASQAIGGVKVQVPEEDFVRAREIMTADYEAELEDIEEARLESSPDEVCPACGAIILPARKYSLWSLIPSLFFLVPIFFRKKGWVCNYCGAALKMKPK